jgi:aryl-alcohol dehydrogenase-like predicted oxidoreductase
VASIVVGARGVAQLDELLGAADVRITAEELTQLDRVSPAGSVIVPYYHDDVFTQFRPQRYRR